MNRNILVVDDDEDMIELLTVFLEQSGFAVGTAKDGYSALEQVNNHHYDLVILDKSMPFVTGHQVLKSIRDNQFTKDLPIIMLTASNDKDDVVRSKELGISDYMIKPPEKVNLINRIERILGGRPQYVEINFPENSQETKGIIGVPIEISSISVAGLTLKTSALMKKGSSLVALEIPLLKMLKIDCSRLKLSLCRKINDGEYQYFVSFINIDKVDGERIRDWIMTKTFKNRSAKN